MVKSVLLVGASGLVGQGVFRSLRRSAGIGEIVLLVRRPIAIADDRVRVLQVDAFSGDNLNKFDLSGLAACVHCAGPLPLGMSARAYREATVELTRCVATAYAAANPHGRLIYVSGMGADARSRLAPFKIKGEAELMLRGLGIPSTSLRPGVIRPVQGEISPHRFRRFAYRLGDPLLALGCAICPSVFTTTRAVGEAVAQLVLATSPPHFLGNAAINSMDSAD
ncbi:MAG: oxidoreductase [Xanthomonadales bacterium PRO7]|jgi:uncharacterized protein YbjT (DUF2867 family)|nr:oxidoreductase [Xanthomonadales bacterium PRO7]HMM57860.1 oxidoreductase [Rudaea sp.]